MDNSRHISKLVGGGRCCACGAFCWFLYALVSAIDLVNSSLFTPQVRNTVRDLDHVRLPNLYICPADRTRMRSITWLAYDCMVSYRSEKVPCRATTEFYKGDYPDALDGRRHSNSGSCLEFQTHGITIAKEWTSSWNEILLRVSFKPDQLFDYTSTQDLLQEVELGYHVVETQFWTQFWRKADVYYYPLLRVPISYIAKGFPRIGVCTRAFLAEETDYLRNIKGNYWFTYGSNQIPVLNTSTPTSRLDPQASPNDLHGIAHVILSIEQFDSVVKEEVPFIIPLFKTIGAIAGVGAFAIWVTFCCIPSIAEGGDDRVVFYSKVAAEDHEDVHGGMHSDRESDVEL